jgi:alcohol dehydrogenase class IV
MVQRCAAALAQHQPDWIIALGGGSCIDTAKAAWLLYENPAAELAGINPFDQYVMREKAHLIAIPTTSGTGSEATWYAVLTDTAEQRNSALVRAKCRRSDHFRSGIDRRCRRRSRRIPP